jgi:glycine oxidase
VVKSELKSDVLIVGGGVIGLSIAWELARREFRVCLLDTHRIGRSASWAGAGILPPVATRNAVDPYEQLRARSHQLHQQWASRLREETGIDTGYQRCGGVYLARSPGEAATLLANQSWWDTHAIEYSPLTRDQLVRLEPELADVSAQVRGAWLLPDECQLRNPRHLQALREACRRAGVRLLEQTEIIDFGSSEGRIASARAADGRVFFADIFCVCAGAWARHFLTQLGYANGIMPVRGQMVLYQCPRPPITRVINEGNRYLVPRTDGLLLAGSVEEEVGYLCETTPEAIQQIRQWAEQLLPHLRLCEVKDTWAGLRPGSYDGLPYIGQVPSRANLYLAAGHFRSGLHLSCATAQAVANLITGKDLEIDLTPFRIGRG